LKRLNVDERNDDHYSGNLCWVEYADEFLERDDRGVLRAMGARDQRQHWSRLRAMEDSHRDTQGRVAPGRHFNRAGSLLTTGRGCSADRKRLAVLCGDRNDKSDS